MICRRFGILGVLLFSSLVAIAQLTQSKRIELPLEDNPSSYDVINLEDKGLLLFRSDFGFDENGRNWNFIRLDTALNVVWSKQFSIDASLKYAKYTSTLEKGYLLFTDSRKGLNLNLVEVDIVSGEAKQHTIRNFIPFQLSHFKASDFGVFIGGSYNYRPLVVYYNLLNRTSMILPGFYHERSELLQIKVNVNQRVDVITSSVSYGSWNKMILQLKSFDKDGNMIQDVLLDGIQDNKSLLFGRSCYENRGTQLVAGTYARRKSEYSRGLFIAAVNEMGEYDINYYSYGDLTNFFGYMKKKREERVKARIERKRMKNKNARFNYRLLVHGIMEYEDQFILLAEAFYPKYIHPTGGQIAGFFVGQRATTEAIFDGYRYTHAVVAGFDSTGKLLWDNSFEIKDIKTFDLKQLVHVNIQDDKIVLLYVYQNQIRSKIIEGNQVVEGKDYNDIALTFTDDQLINKSISDLNFWYDKYFYVFGNQNIRNVKDLNVKLERRVFYINKVYYD